jgi:small subunit ribosomal protein S3Ae
MEKIIKEKSANLTMDQFAQEMVLGKIASDIYNEAKKVAPIRHVGIRKSKLVIQTTKAPAEKKEEAPAEEEKEEQAEEA